jgi:hypothetical protein
MIPSQIKKDKVEENIYETTLGEISPSSDILVTLLINEYE